MPANTTRLALPYPLADDTVDVPRDILALANALDAQSSIKPTVIAAPNPLPASPADGQEVYYLAAPGIATWHLRYNAASPGGFKWEVLGGGPITNGDYGANKQLFVGGNATWGIMSDALAGNAPSPLELTVPLAGNYWVTVGGSGTHDQIGQYTSYLGYAVGATAPQAHWAACWDSYNYSTHIARDKSYLHGIAAGAKLAVQAWRSNTGFIPYWYGYRFIRAMPTVVG